MRTPRGFRSDSSRTPNASRAGALYSHRYSHIYMQKSAAGRIHRQGLIGEARGIVAAASTATASMDGSLRSRFGGGC